MNLDFVERPHHLDVLLNVSDVEDLDILVDYITDKGDGRIALDDAECKRLVACKAKGAYDTNDRALISYEIRRFGGNTLTNLLRDARRTMWGSAIDNLLPDMDSTVGYDEIVRDVASHLKVPCNKSSPVPVVEDGILRKILTDSFEKMSDEERKAMLAELNVSDLSMLKPAAAAAAIGIGKLGGFATYKIALVVANAVARSILGKGLTLAGNRLLMRSLGVLLGPVGWILSGLWTVADMASPAYRVTVPCVIQVAYLRQKALAKAYATNCEQCGAPNPVDSKFCSECGASMVGQA
ncbi:MAG: hypothetical protein K2X55_24380 [Burkholderiaceae bacterium]|nr:hypothetical protein [Burkholderiaceae bacterium]